MGLRGPKKGTPRVGGRQKGTPNKLTASFKAAVLEAFNNLGGVESFVLWGHENRTEFYKIAARLIPHEVIGPGQDGAHLIKTVQHVHEVVSDGKA